MGVCSNQIWEVNIMAHIYNEYLVARKGSVMWEYVNGTVDCSNLGKWNN